MTTLNGAPPEQGEFGQQMGKTQTGSIPSLPEMEREQQLTDITLLDMLDRDDRPTFAFRVQSAPERDVPFDWIYHNPALAAVEGLIGKVSGQHEATSMFAETGGSQLAFRDWLCGKAHEGDLARRGNAYQFEGHVQEHRT